MGLEIRTGISPIEGENMKKLEIARKNAIFTGGPSKTLSQGLLKTSLALGLAWVVSACNKKEPPAVVEEVPPAPTVQTDTTATLADEPDLKKVGDDAKPGRKAKPSANAQEAGFSDHGSFVVQVSVFKNKRGAAHLVEKLANEGYPAYVAEVESPTPEMSGTYHRVRIGRFQRIADARAFGQNTLKPSGYEFWVDNKKNDMVGGNGGGFSAEPAAVSRPSAPAEPKAPSEPSAPSMPSSEAYTAPKAEAPAAPAPIPAAAAQPREPESKPDTSKANLDEW